MERCVSGVGPGALQRLQTVISEYHPLISSHKIIPKPPLYIEEIVRLNLHCQEMEVLQTDPLQKQQSGCVDQQKGGGAGS